MRQIIINADDLGADEARNEGIFDAIRAEIVTSVSLLANGPATEGALRTLRSINDNAISSGFHVNLSEGKPLSSNLRLLVGEDGCFRGKSPTRKILMQSAEPDLEAEIKHEMGCQIDALLDYGLKITHIDGHQHVHVFPAVFPVALEIAERYKIPWIRIPEEPVPQPGAEAVPPWLMEEGQWFSSVAQAARMKLKGSAVCTPEHFRGLYLKGRFSLALLLDLMEAIPPGLTELMVHPGRIRNGSSAGPFSSFSTMDRVKELETLLDPAFSKSLRDHQLRLVPFQSL